MKFTGAGLEGQLLLRHVHSFDFQGDGLAIRVMRDDEEGGMHLIRHMEDPWRPPPEPECGPAILVEKDPGGPDLYWIPWSPTIAVPDGYIAITLGDREACSLAVDICEGLREVDDSKTWPDATGS